MHRAYQNIRQFPPFSSLSDEEFASFKRCTTVCSVNRHTVLCHEGDMSECAFVLAGGEVGEQWADGVATHHQPGTILQPTALLSDQACKHTLVAHTDASIIKLGRKNFLKMFQKEQLVAYLLLEEISQVLAHEIRDLNRCLNELLKEGHGEPRG